MKRVVAWCAAAVTAATASAAVGGTLGVSSGRVGANDLAVPSCDANGFSYAFTTSRGNVTSVTVDDIADPGCESGILRLTLTDAGGASIASGGPLTVPTDGDVTANSLAVTVSPQPAAGQVVGVEVMLEGP